MEKWSHELETIEQSIAQDRVVIANTSRDLFIGQSRDEAKLGCERRIEKIGRLRRSENESRPKEPGPTSDRKMKLGLDSNCQNGEDEQSRQRSRESFEQVDALPPRTNLCETVDQLFIEFLRQCVFGFGRFR